MYHLSERAQGLRSNSVCLSFESISIHEVVQTKFENQKVRNCERRRIQDILNFIKSSLHDCVYLVEMSGARQPVKQEQDEPFDIEKQQHQFDGFSYRRKSNRNRCVVKVLVVSFVFSLGCSAFFAGKGAVVKGPSQSTPLFSSHS